MTYLIDFRKQVLRSIKDSMMIRETAIFYHLSSITIHSWQQELALKITRIKHQLKYQMKHY